MAGPEALPQSGTKVILEDPLGRVLSLLRDDNPGIPYPDTWDLVGGGQEPGETLLECGAREIEEEIGLTGLKLQMLHVVHSRLYDGVVFGRAYGKLTGEQAGQVIHTSEGRELGFFLPRQIAVINFVPQLQEFVLARYGIANRAQPLERIA